MRAADMTFRTLKDLQGKGAKVVGVEQAIYVKSANGAPIGGRLLKDDKRTPGREVDLQVVFEVGGIAYQVELKSQRTYEAIQKLLRRNLRGEDSQLLKDLVYFAVPQAGKADEMKGVRWLFDEQALGANSGALFDLVKTEIKGNQATMGWLVKRLGWSTTDQTAAMKELDRLIDGMRADDFFGTVKLD